MTADNQHQPPTAELVIAHTRAIGRALGEYAALNVLADDTPQADTSRAADNACLDQCVALKARVDAALPVLGRDLVARLLRGTDAPPAYAGQAVATQTIGDALGGRPGERVGVGASAGNP